jgi:uncharacterized protein
MPIAYFHGFASSPEARKAIALRDAFAPRDVLRPDLNVPSFAQLSMGAMLARIDELDRDRSDKWSIVGSSLGGWLAARWAELHPDRVAKLLLLCPAFDVPDRWREILGTEGMAEWKRAGTYETPDARGVPTPIHYTFYEEACEQVVRPEPRCETTVIHGVRDTRVPIESSRRFAREHPHARLIEVDDVHDLHASIPIILAHARSFFSV